MALSRKSPYVDTKHKVSGMMLANHTCMAELFKRALAQYDTIISRNAYLHQVRPSRVRPFGLCPWWCARAGWGLSASATRAGGISVPGRAALLWRAPFLTAFDPPIPPPPLPPPL